MHSVEVESEVQGGLAVIITKEGRTELENTTNGKEREEEEVTNFVLEQEWGEGDFFHPQI